MASGNIIKIDIHISVHHATSKKPTKIHLKLGSKENLKIREFSSVARDGRITSPCRGHMYKNTSNKKLNKYRKFVMFYGKIG